MSTTTSTIIICFTILLAPIIWNFFKRTSELGAELRPLPTPLDCIRRDLSVAFGSVMEELGGRHFKGDNFPLKIPVKIYSTWIPDDQVIPIIAAQLERLGWVVYQDEECHSQTHEVRYSTFHIIEIKVDLPRARVPFHHKTAAA